MTQLAIALELEVAFMSTSLVDTERNRRSFLERRRNRGKSRAA